MLWAGVVMCWSRGEGHSGSGRDCSREHRRRGQDVHRRKDCWFLFLSLLKPPWPFIEKACITRGILFGCMPVPSMAQLDADSFLRFAVGLLIILDVFLSRSLPSGQL